MVPYFLWGTIILLVATTIFYVVFFSLVYYWRERKENFIIVPALYTFEFFITGFVIISVVAIFLQYLPDIINLAS